MVGLDAGPLSLIDLFIVNFEPFCGNDKPVERPESSVEGLYALRDFGGTSGSER
jgi:hypothetical protein